MPYVYLYQCDQCAFDVELSFCREFRRESDGSRAPYEYPNPDLYEWPPKRVSGLWSQLWCPSCRALREHVLVEFEEPAEHPVQAFLAAEAQGLSGTETGPCGQCGTTMLTELDKHPCPQCGGGRLQCIGEYEP